MKKLIAALLPLLVAISVSAEIKNGIKPMYTGLVYESLSEGSHVAQNGNQMLLTIDGWKLKCKEHPAGEPGGICLNFELSLKKASVNLFFAPMQDQKRLAPGMYPVTRFPFNKGENAGLDFTMGSRGHNKLAGQMMVHEIEYDKDGAPIKVAIDFILFEEFETKQNKNRGVFGSFRLRSTRPFNASFHISEEVEVEEVR